MFQFRISTFNMFGDGSGVHGSYPYQLWLRVLGVAEASAKNIYINNYDTVAHAKADAFSVFGANFVGGVSGTYWTDSDNEGGSVVVESLSVPVVISWGTGSAQTNQVED
jgi:hypothetical protein